VETDPRHRETWHISPTTQLSTNGSQNVKCVFELMDCSLICCHLSTQFTNK